MMGNGPFFRRVLSYRGVPVRKASVLLLSLLVLTAQNLPIRIDNGPNVLPPAISADGSLILFAAATSPEGDQLKATNLFAYSGQRGFSPTVRQLTNFTSDLRINGITSVTYPGSGSAGAFTAIPGGPGSTEEVHVINVLTGADRTVATDKEGCIQPLCVNCFRACVGPVHMTPDGGRVLYAAARERSFFVLNADGTSANRLPVFYGALAPSPQRVIARDGTFVFTSNAPNGPTFAPAATDVYTMNLDGTGMKNVTRFRDTAFYSTGATVSLDGSLISFASNYSESGPQQSTHVWEIRSDGTGLLRLSRGSEPATDPSISGDGLIVTYVQGGQIVRVLTRPDASSVLPLTKLSTSMPSNPTLSEDGKQVAFNLSHISGPPAAVYRIPADSTSTFDRFTPVFTPRVILPNGAVSAAGHGRPSPGSLMTIYGANLGAEELAKATAFPLPTALGGVSLLMNGLPLPLVAVTPWQINAQVPQTISGTTAVLQIRSSAGTTASTNIEIRDRSPENFSYSFTRERASYLQAAAFHAGTAIAADMEHPAATGETLEIYALGLGITDPVVPPGMPSPLSPLARARVTPRIEIGRREAVVTFAGLVPGLAGVYQANVIVPSGLPAGLSLVSWQTPDGNTAFSSIAIQ